MNIDAVVASDRTLSGSRGIYAKSYGESVLQTPTARQVHRNGSKDIHVLIYAANHKDNEPVGSIIAHFVDASEGDLTPTVIQEEMAVSKLQSPRSRSVTSEDPTCVHNVI